MADKEDYISLLYRALDHAHGVVSDDYGKEDRRLKKYRLRTFPDEGIYEGDGQQHVVEACYQISQLFKRPFVSQSKRELGLRRSLQNIFAEAEKDVSSILSKTKSFGKSGRFKGIPLILETEEEAISGFPDSVYYPAEWQVPDAIFNDEWIAPTVVGTLIMNGVYEVYNSRKPGKQVFIDPKVIQKSVRALWKLCDLLYKKTPVPMLYWTESAFGKRLSEQDFAVIDLLESGMLYKPLASSPVLIKGIEVYKIQKAAAWRDHLANREKLKKKRGRIQVNTVNPF